MSSSSSPVITGGSSPLPMPICRAIAAAVIAWSPVTTMIRMPAAWQRSTASATSGRGGSSIATSPRKVSPRSASSRSSGAGAVVEPAPGDAEDPQALARRRRQPGVRQRLAPASPSESLAVLPGDARAAGQAAPPARPLRRPTAPRRDRRPSTSASAPGRSGTGAPGAARAMPRRSSAPSAAAASSIATSVGSPLDPPPVDPGVVALGHRLREPARGLRAPGSGGGRASSASEPAPLQTAVTRMRFSVSVPVLSVQITSVEPSVSTALRRFTTAPWRTRSRTPTASARVITGSSPSGTLPTSSPIANTTASASGQPGDEERERDEGDRRWRPRSRRSARRPGGPGARAGSPRARPAGTARRSGPARCACRSRRPPPGPRPRCRSCR